MTQPLFPFKELTLAQAVVLAFTIDRPRYGYEIASRVEHGVTGSFLIYLDVYKALESLEQMGYVNAVDRDIMTTKRRRDTRRWFQATTRGREAHGRWVMTALTPESERTAILGRITSAARLGTSEIRRILTECEKYCDERECALDAIQKLDMEYPNIYVLCDKLVFAERKIALRGLREWVQVARNEVDAFVQQAHRHPKRITRPERSVCY
jgi:DNA-binding PadR family transcriptional regulator